MKNYKKAIVIGGGFGGLSLGIRLQKLGYQTTLLEKRDQIGGRAYVFRDKGFTFDAGPTVITAPECLEELFTLAGRKMSDYVEMMPVTPFYRLSWDDGFEFDYSNDEQSLKKQILAKSPGDWDGYQKFLKYSKNVFKAGYTELAHKPFLSFWSMARCAPQLMKLQAHRSVYSMVASFIKDEKLREAFSFHSLLVGGNPFATSSIYTLIHYLERNWGVFFPRGGTGALIEALGTLFTDMGGTIRLNAEVDEIVSEGKQITGVRLKSQEFIQAPLVACNSDVAHTYRDLLRNTKEVEKPRRKALNSQYSMSLFLIYFGTKKKYPNQAHHQVIFGPRYEDLLKDIFDRKVLADDFSLYLHTPTASDPNLAPPGHEGFYVLSPVPHLEKGDIDWKTAGPKYADRILDYLDAKFLPGLKENLVTKRIFTPEDFKSQLNAHFGSAFSIEPLLTQSAYFRTHNRAPGVQGLYFVGAGTHPGAGVPGVVNSAKATAEVIAEDM